MEKILSLIVPTYNMEQYLDRCLASLVIREDLMSKIEVLVINDGSTDASSDIARRFVEGYPDTYRVIDKENGHYGSCVNNRFAAKLQWKYRLVQVRDWLKGKFPFL